MLDQMAIENRLEQLHKSLSELRPPGPSDRHLSSIIVTDRIDHLGNYLHVDPIAEELSGYPPAYWATETDWIQYSHALDLGRTSLLWGLALKGRPSYGIEYRDQHNDHYWLWLKDSFIPVLTDHRGRALVIEGRWSDITPRKRCELEFLIRELEQSLRQLKAPARSGRTVMFRQPGPWGRGARSGVPARSRPRGSRRGRPDRR